MAVQRTPSTPGIRVATRSVKYGFVPYWRVRCCVPFWTYTERHLFCIWLSEWASSVKLHICIFSVNHASSHCKMLPLSMVVLQCTCKVRDKTWLMNNEVCRMCPPPLSPRTLTWPDLTLALTWLGSEAINESPDVSDHWCQLSPARESRPNIT